MLNKITSPAATAYLHGQQFAQKAEQNGDFTSILNALASNVAQTGAKADAMAAQAAAGLKPDVVNVVTAVAESEAALETLVAVRDRVVQAYDDIMRMPI